MKKKTMKIKQMYLTNKEIEEISREAKDKDISFAEMLRRAIDFYLDNKRDISSNKS